MHQVYQLHTPFVIVFLLFAIGFALTHSAGERR
jgi:hypothetical protein